MNNQIEGVFTSSSSFLLLFFHSSARFSTSFSKLIVFSTESRTSWTLGGRMQCAACTSSWCHLASERFSFYTNGSLSHSSSSHLDLDTFFYNSLLMLTMVIMLIIRYYSSKAFLVRQVIVITDATLFQEKVFSPWRRYNRYQKQNMVDTINDSKGKYITCRWIIHIVYYDWKLQTHHFILHWSCEKITTFSKLRAYRWSKMETWYRSLFMLNSKQEQSLPSTMFNTNCFVNRPLKEVAPFVFDNKRFQAAQTRDARLKTLREQCPQSLIKKMLAQDVYLIRYIPKPNEPWKI